MSSEEEPEQAEPSVWEVGWSIELQKEIAGETSADYAKVGNSHRRQGTIGILFLKSLRGHGKQREKTSKRGRQGFLDRQQALAKSLFLSLGSEKSSKDSKPKILKNMTV